MFSISMYKSEGRGFDADSRLSVVFFYSLPSVKSYFGFWSTNKLARYWRSQQTARAISCVLYLLSRCFGSLHNLDLADRIANRLVQVNIPTIDYYFFKCFSRSLVAELAMPWTCSKVYIFYYFSYSFFWFCTYWSVCVFCSINIVFLFFYLFMFATIR